MPENDCLFVLLSQLSQEQLNAIRRIPLSIKKDNNEVWSKEYLVAMISAELRSAAGNSIVNLWRQEQGFPYKQMIIDVG